MKERNSIREENRLLKLHINILIGIIIIVSFLSASFIAKTYNSNIITINNTIKEELDLLFKASFPNEYISCLNYDKDDNIVNSHYIPISKDATPYNVTYQRCKTLADIHSHPIKNPLNNYLSSTDKESLELDNPSCIQTDINEIRCFVLKRMEVRYTNDN